MWAQRSSSQPSVCFFTRNIYTLRSDRHIKKVFDLVEEMNLLLKGRFFSVSRLNERNGE